MITLWSFVGFAAGRSTRLLHDYIVKTIGLFDNDNIMQIKCDNSILSSDYGFFAATGGGLNALCRAAFNFIILYLPHWVI